MQYYYQCGSLYRLRALGERRTMDITVGMSTVDMSSVQFAELMLFASKKQTGIGVTLGKCTVSMDFPDSSTQKVMQSPVFVCLSVCLLVCWRIM